jgi:hypothetical protein
MTYAPPTLTALATYWKAQGGVNLGVVGDTGHQQRGVSYHLGKDKLIVGAYSARTARDRAGLTNGASAIDLGRLDGSLGQLRAFSAWLVTQARANKAGTSDIREIIYSPDGRRVLRWDRERGYRSLPREGEADASHLTHTHVSWYRDAEKRDHTITFRPYFAPPVRFRVVVEAGATVRVYGLGATGTPKCIDRWTDQVWSHPASSAPATYSVRRQTCDGTSAATTSLVTGGAFAGKHVRIGQGVSLVKA